jgi:transcriptional regulator with XRE-family HTH domain
VSPYRLRICLEILSWSQRDLAAKLGVDPKQVQRWMAGASLVPLSTESWLEGLVLAHQAHPAPVR